MRNPRLSRRTKKTTVLQSLASLALFIVFAPRLALGAEEAAWQHDTEALTQTTCRAALRLPFPIVTEAPAGCDALALYDGFGRHADYRAARTCALGSRTDASLLGNKAVLAMIYANGDGVARDDHRAIAYTCEAGGAPAEVDGRVRHLLDRKREGATVKTRFDFCDDITSGFMQGACAARKSRQYNLEREKTLDELAGTLSPREALAYKALRRAAETYAKAVGENETDLSGTGRAAFVIEATDGERRNFLETLSSLLAGEAIKGSGLTYAKADASLNTTYQSVQGQTDDFTFGTITKANIKTTEKAWLAYRDRFVEFARIAAPNASSDALAALLSQQRTSLLENFLASADR